MTPTRDLLWQFEDAVRTDTANRIHGADIDQSRAKVDELAKRLRTGFSKSSPSELDALLNAEIEQVLRDAERWADSPSFTIRSALIGSLVKNLRAAHEALRSSVLQRDRLAIRDKAWGQQSAHLHEVMGNLIAGRDADAAELSRLREELRQANEDKQALIEGRVRMEHDYKGEQFWFFKATPPRDVFHTADEALTAYRSQSAVPAPSSLTDTDNDS